MHNNQFVFAPRHRQQDPVTGKRAFNAWLVAAAAMCCATASAFTGLSRVDIGVAHAAGLLSGQGHPVAAVVSGLAAGGASTGTAATGAVGAVSGAAGTAATGAVGAATGAVGTAATGAFGAATGAVGATTGAVGTAATGALGATTGAVGAATNTIGTAATSTSGAATSAVGATTTTISTGATGTSNAATGAVGAATTAATTGSAVDPMITADDSDALAALRAKGLVGPVHLTARWVNSDSEPCREYVQTVTINNAPVHATAVVCRRAWGTWHVVGPVIRGQPAPQQAAQQ